MDATRTLDRPTVGDVAPASAAPAGDVLWIRGRRLDLATLVNPALRDPAHVAALRERLHAAQPFPHLVVDGWFDPTLLELVREEFDTHARRGWRTVRSPNEQTQRLSDAAMLGPASQLYFGIVNGGWFLDLLTALTDIEDLIADPRLYGGGLHESRNGDKFGVHRDFDRHVRHGFDNRMVFITYLNRDWNPQWGAALELWGGEPRVKQAEVVPEMGRSILLPHGPDSYHGHPHPMNAPDGRTRRSVASYYYTNAQAVRQRAGRVSSVFLAAHRSRSLRQFVWRWTPPALFELLKKIVAR